MDDFVLLTTWNLEKTWEGISLEDSQIFREVTRKITKKSISVINYFLKKKNSQSTGEAKLKGKCPLGGCTPICISPKKDRAWI